MSEPESKTGQARADRKSFLRELRDREVFQTAGAYAVIAWGVTEIVDGVVERLGWPEWLATATVILFVVGFPVAMFLAWVFDWTPQGIRRDEPWRARSWASVAAAGLFLLAGSAALFWLINPSQIVRVERVGVAVLPCRYRGEEDYRFRGEGMAELIQAQLARDPSLRVPAYRSVVILAGRNLPTAEFARMAGVQWLVDCRLAREEQGWALDVALVDASSDTTEPLYGTEAGEAELADASARSARAIASRIAPDSSASSPENPLGFPAQARSLDAYLRGEQAIRRATADDFHRARQLFREAQNVPGFALARVREADALMAELEAAGPGKESQTEASLRAVALILDAAEAQDNSVAELYAGRMRLDLLSSRLQAGRAPDLERQREWLRQAVALRPSYAEPYWLLADALRTAGANGEAEKAEDAARLLDPVL
jgi:TolB-like protein